MIKMDEIPLEVLRSFVVFVESANMVAAAEKLKVSQPLLTKHLQILERAVDRALFTFEGRKKICTRFGTEFHQIVKHHLEGLSQDLQRLELRQGDPAHAKIRIAGNRDILENIAKRVHFAGTLEFIPMSGREVVDVLEKNQIEIGISQYDLESYSFVRKNLFQGNFKLVVPKDWNIRGKKLAEILSELSQKPYLSYGGSDALAELFRSEGILAQVMPARSFPGWPLLVEMVRKKLGWALVPEGYLQDSSQLKLIDIPEKSIARTQFRVYYPREFSGAAWFQDLLKEIGV